MAVIDTRGLFPPEPFERIIDALRSLKAGERLEVVLDREPLPLFRFLDRNDYRYETVARTSDRVELVIWEP